jgi:predicted O-methyltransferase YrrM
MLIASRCGSEKRKAKMYSRLRLARKYLHYYLVASNGKGHGTHSPFVFEFITRVLNDRRDYPAYARIETLRDRLLRDQQMIEVQDLGAGSAMGGRAIRQHRIADIARHAAKSRKLGQLLFRIARYYQCGSMLELGTSLGVSAAYLASGAGETGKELVTIEGSNAMAAVAEENFRSLGLESIGLIVGDFDHMLTGVLDRRGNVDLAFVDGNHRREPTLRYFNLLVGRIAPSAVLIFDDIHWSAEMEQAWEEIKRDPRVMLTVDLFFIGLVFFREEFKVKQDFVIRF